jgi:hypothetical protein
MYDKKTGICRTLPEMGCARGEFGIFSSGNPLRQGLAQLLITCLQQEV